MPYQFLRGNTADNDNYVGPVGSFTIDMDTWDVRLHDGTKPGGHIVGLAGSIPTATNSQSGLMSFSDKAKLDSIFAGAEVNAVSSVNGDTGDVVIPDATTSTAGLVSTNTQVFLGDKTFSGIVTIDEGAI